MSKPLFIQLALDANVETVFRALTLSDELGAWFAERADISPQEERYDFWGRFTPEVPDREEGRHPLLDLEFGSRLSYGWQLQAAETSVRINLEWRDEQTLVILRHDGLLDTPHDLGQFVMEDFWFLSLENLRRYLDGKGIVRCDFSRSTTGDIEHVIEIDAPAQDVFEALIKPEQLERWIASNATVEPWIGGRYNVGWGEEGGPVKILDLVHNERLAYLWDEERETIVTWTLEGSGSKTRLTFVHSGFAPNKPTGGYGAGWLNFMSWIKSLVEYGPEWKPPVLSVTPEAIPYYPASIGTRQGELYLVSST